jgi:xanthine dehydrogenase accessory factor
MHGAGRSGDGEILGLAARLSERGRPFALATVISRLPPSSSHVGQKALVEADGSFHGWLGGACVEPVVQREAQAAMRDGRPRIVVLAPDAHSDRADAIVYPMTCHSGGTVEIYVEPQLPAPVLALFGDSPVTHALAAMATGAGYRVRVAEAEEDAEAAEPVPAGEAELFALVATLGVWDEGAVERALRAGARYVGLVASPRRAKEVRRLLLERGWEEAALAPLVSPAGLDIGAREPAEIAISILAQLILVRRRDADEREGVAAGGEGVAVDPVCGMEVETESARHTLDHEGVTLFFCGSGCRERYARNLALAIDA